VLQCYVELTCPPRAYVMEGEAEDDGRGGWRVIKGAINALAGVRRIIVLIPTNALT